MNKQVDRNSTNRALSIRDAVQSNYLLPIQDDLQRAMPSTVDPDRFRSALIIAVQNEPKILKCQPESVRNSLMKCASDGLVPDGRQAALVPFYDNDEKCFKAQYLPMVQGIISRLHELGETFSVTANVVYANDVFIIDETDPSRTEHTRPRAEGVKNCLVDPNRGAIVGAYVIFRDSQGRFIHREIMDKPEIDKTRNVSKAKNSPAWNQWFGEMARKTVIRRGGKYVPMSETARKLIEREDEYVDFGDGGDQPEGYNPLLDNKVIDNDPPAQDQHRSNAQTQPAGTQKADRHPNAPDNDDAEASSGNENPAARSPTASQTGDAGASAGERNSTSDGAPSAASGSSPDVGTGQAGAPGIGLPFPGYRQFAEALQRATQEKSLGVLNTEFRNKNAWTTEEEHKQTLTDIYDLQRKKITNQIPERDYNRIMVGLIGPKPAEAKS